MSGRLIWEYLHLCNTFTIIIPNTKYQHPVSPPITNTSKTHKNAMDGILRNITTKSCFRHLRPTEGDNVGAFHHLEDVIAYLELLGLLFLNVLLIHCTIAMLIYIYFTITSLHEGFTGKREFALWPLYDSIHMSMRTILTSWSCPIKLFCIPPPQPIEHMFDYYGAQPSTRHY
jgi:hypothetical protein